MLPWEQRLQASLRKNILLWAFFAVFLLGLFLRYSYLPFLAADLKFMNLRWLNAIKTGGMASVFEPQNQWTYSPLHLYLWAFFAWLLPTVDGVLVLKGVSFIMEAGLMVGCGLLLWEVLPAKNKPLRMFAGMSLLWLNPILVFNVAGWGQTDASYVALCVLSLWLMMKHRPSWAMVAFGLAIGFKLQAVFLLPAFLFLYFCQEKKFSALWFFLIPIVWIATGLPMAFLGQSPWYAVQVYFGQTALYNQPTFNCPNLFALLGDALTAKPAIQGLWQRYGLVLAIFVLGGMATWFIHGNKRVSRQNVLLLSAWCVFVCVFFLPRMHERYGMAGEVLLVLWAVQMWKPRGFVYAMLLSLPTISAYCQYMFSKTIFSLQSGAALNLLVLCLLTWELIRQTGLDAPLPGAATPKAASSQSPS